MQVKVKVDEKESDVLPQAQALLLRTTAPNLKKDSWTYTGHTYNVNVLYPQPSIFLKVIKQNQHAYPVINLPYAHTKTHCCSPSHLHSKLSIRQ